MPLRLASWFRKTGEKREEIKISKILKSIKCYQIRSTAKRVLERPDQYKEGLEQRVSSKRGIASGQTSPVQVANQANEKRKEGKGKEKKSIGKTTGMN